MASLQRLKERVATLVGEGQQILASARSLEMGAHSSIADQIIQDYNKWYSQARIVIASALPEHESEFVKLYSLGPQDGASYHVRHLVYEHSPWSHEIEQFRNTMTAQIGLLSGIPGAAELRALMLKGLVAYDLMTDEMQAARHLLENGFVRAAGAVAGVVLERHLKLMCETRHIKSEEKETIGSLNNKLKEQYDAPAHYKKVSWMSEVRAACDHEKKKEPTPEQVEEFIEAAQKFIATVS